MAYLFSDLQTEVTRRATRNQSGGVYTIAIKNIINASLFRMAREANWKALHRQTTFNTVATYTTGTVSATNGSSSFTGTSLNWITNAIAIDRRLTISGSNLRYTVTSITGENSFTTDYLYDGTTASGLTYVLYGQETYNLPVQTNKEALIYHEKFGFPFKMRYITDNEFYSSAVNNLISYTPTHYHMWEQDMVITQLTSASVVSISSSSNSDMTQAVTIFGTVSGYPDFEIINLNGTTVVPGSKTFSAVERVTKNGSTIGRVTITGNSATTTVAIIPVGYQTDGIPYKKIRLFPLPDSVFPMAVHYYKQPYRLVNDGDVHELGQEFDEALILLATAKIKLEDNVDEGKTFMQLYADEIKSLKQFNVDKMDWLPTLLRPENAGYYTNKINRFLSYANLGGSYGPSTL